MRNSCNPVTNKKSECGIGQYYPDGETKNIYGYQNIKTAIRRLVIDGKLKSIDLVNAHVRVLTSRVINITSIMHEEIQLIMHHFAVNHFPGYTTAVKIAMEVKIKKHKDDFRSALGLYLQDIESQIIMCLYDTISKNSKKCML
jgi:hypothetical protein